MRLERAEAARLTRAFAISLALHLLVVGTYQAGKKFRVWENWQWPAWVQSAKMLTEIFKKKSAVPLPQQDQVPLLFVDVSQAQASTEPPKDAKYYSDKSSRAANPEADQDTNIPKITGKQTDVPKTEDVPRENFTPLQPARPVPQDQPSQEAMQAKPAQTPGDLTMAKPELTLRKDEGKDAQSRPRTIQEARARQRDSSVPGIKMKQEGGVRRHLDMASLDVKATPFGAYDAALVEAISQRWFDLLDERVYASDSRGKVVLQFKLHYDGRITDMTVAENNAGEVFGLICEKAVLDPAPFAPFPGDLRRMLGDSRHIQFSFYYY